MFQRNPELVETGEVLDFVKLLCFPVTRAWVRDSGRGNKGAGEGHVFQAVCEFLAMCVASPFRLHQPEVGDVVMTKCRESLLHYRGEHHGGSHSNHEEEDTGHNICDMSISSTLTVLSRVAEQFEGDKGRMCDKDADSWRDLSDLMLDMLDVAEPSMCVQLAQLANSSLSTRAGKRTKEEMRDLTWKQVLKMHSRARDYSEEMNENVFLLLCALSDEFLPCAKSGKHGKSNDSDADKNMHMSDARLLRDATFWELVQVGLVHSNPLTRKRAAYLLKRTVDVAATWKALIPMECESEPSHQPLFSWNPSSKDELLRLWLEFFLIYETLDEVQIHVVTPVLPRIANIARATYVSNIKGNGGCTLHSSWLCILYQRCFVHQSKTVTRLGVANFLGLDLVQSSLLRQDGLKFILGPLLNALHEEYLYTKAPEDTQGEHPPIGLALTKFMSACVSQLPLETHAGFLVDLLTLICEQSWGPVTILFIAEALANIPQCPVWGKTSLFMLKNKLSTGFLTCPTGYRSSIQCFFLRAAMRLLDWSDVSLSEMSGLLASCNATDVLKRGSPLWKEICDALNESFSSEGGPEPASSLWQQTLQEVKDHLHVDPTANFSEAGDLPDIQKAQRVAVIVLLVRDAQHSDLQKNSLPASDLLHPLLEVLSRAGSHVYQPSLKSDKALQLLLMLLRESNMASWDHGDLLSCLTSMLSSTLGEIFQYLLRRLLANQESQECDVGRVALYGSFLDSLLSFATRLGRDGQGGMSLTAALTEGKRLFIDGVQLLVGVTDSPKGSAHGGQFRDHILTTLLAWLLRLDDFIPTPSLPPPSDILDALLGIKSSVNAHKDAARVSKGLGSTVSDHGRIQSGLIQTKWEGLLTLVQRSGPHADCGRLDLESLERVFSGYLMDIGLVSSVQAVPLLKCATLLIDKVAERNVPSCLEGVNAAWTTVLDGWTANVTFWCVYEAFVALTYQPALLQHGEGSEVHATLQKFTSKIMNQGQTRLGMVNVLISHLAGMLSKHFFQRPPKDRHYDAMTVVRNISDILQEAVLFGPTILKSVRLMEDVSAYLVQHEGLLTVRRTLRSGSNATDPRHPRVAAINILIQIGNSDLQGKESFFEDFLMSLLDKDEEITPVRRSYIINSMVHRLKLRIWQVAVVIVQFLSETSAERMLGKVLRALRAENQTSTRHLMELFVVRLLHLHPHLVDQFWAYAAEVANSEEVSFSPLLMIIAHLGTVHPKEQQEAFYMRAIPTVLPWTFVPAMALRTQAQVSLCKMWRDCQEAGLQAVIDRYPGVAVCMDFTKNSNALEQLRKRMDGSFFLKFFHPVLDLSVETIFHTMPYLTLVTDDELVRPELFLVSDASPWKRDDACAGMPLFNGRDTLRTCKLKEKKKLTSVKDAEIREVSWLEDGSADVQKKITPWKEAPVPGLEPSAGQRSTRGHLVVVASLVDRIPNLGGLCRTCEIFGASCLVLGNLLLKDHQDFLSLSVSAERWLPIREVKPGDLKDYMLEMKKHGYALVGVEQTANSQALTDFKFPKRTMLLLGKEREGIPVDLIQFLDVCVEIPQMGFIRSLNVHVSGALMIWEYTRQNLLNQLDSS
ncbi:probable methyltransferase TARBP1 [Diadema antillarum]|uniref:probable methyltransferase TARBP1 n=1 Tax=Diadema antillarum TaxID=105358 RepID=UPI003A8678FF